MTVEVAVGVVMRMVVLMRMVVMRMVVVMVGTMAAVT